MGTVDRKKHGGEKPCSLFFFGFIYGMRKVAVFFCLMDYKTVGVDNHERDYVTHFFLGQFLDGIVVAYGKHLVYIINRIMGWEQVGCFCVWLKVICVWFQGVLVVWVWVVWDSNRASPKNPNPFHRRIPGFQKTNPNQK